MLKGCAFEVKFGEVCLFENGIGQLLCMRVVFGKGIVLKPPAKSLHPVGRVAEKRKLTYFIAYCSDETVAKAGIGKAVLNVLIA